MSKKNEYLDLDDEEDFGFTFTHEEEIIETNQTYSTLQEEVDDLKKRLVAIQKIFLPLLENLAKDADKPMIKWPNRKDIIDKQIKKLNTLTKV
jgi:flagellar motility protein MotE (MotC chaperone)